MKEQIEKHELSDSIYMSGYGLDHKDSDDIAEQLYTEGYRKLKYGKWEKRTFIIFDSEKVGYNCSGCNTTWDSDTNFCPNCGAHMRGGIT